MASRTPRSTMRVWSAAGVLVLGLLLALVACVATAVTGEASRWIQVVLYAGLVVSAVGVVAMVAADGIGPAQH